ncbi:MAG: DUF1697 domain-containing protein [Chloracidobacterium sp.]|nr:DUF1697 domain-containing protein [Chloracidobacterium sp.]
MRYVALLRGINVSGKNMIKMEALRATFESLGFKNVVSYINSGNLAFDCVKSAEAKIVNKLEDVIQKDFGINISVMVREQNAIASVLANNPFDGQYETHKQMHVLFMRDQMPIEKQAALVEFQTDREKFAVKGLEIYAMLLDGVAESVVFKKNFIEGKLKTPITGRNWRTVETIASL